MNSTNEIKIFKIGQHINSDGKSFDKNIQIPLKNIVRKTYSDRILLELMGDTTFAESGLKENNSSINKWDISDKQRKHLIKLIKEDTRIYKEITDENYIDDRQLFTKEDLFHSRKNIIDYIKNLITGVQNAYNKNNIL